MIASIGYSNKEVIKNIIELHIPSGRIELDPTYSLGKFYKELPQPIHKADINPQRSDIEYCDSRNLLNFPVNSCSSIMFDPPFCFGIHGKTLQNISAKRFTMFSSFTELQTMYKDSLREFYRILKPKGVLVFKCQDYTDSRTTMTHCLVYNWAMTVGFYAKDLFILINKSRIWNPRLRQRHSRKCHSYFWVFVKR